MTELVWGLRGQVEVGGTAKSIPGSAGIVLLANQRLASDSGNFVFKFDVVDRKQQPVVGYEWRIYEKDPIEGILGTVELAGEEGSTTSNQQYNYYVAEPKDIVLQIMHSEFEEINLEFTITGEESALLIILTSEGNV